MGSALLLLAIVASPYLKERWMLRAKNVVSWFTILLMAMACPPFLWIVYAGFFATFVIWFVVSNTASTSESWARWRLTAAAVLAISVLALSASELARRQMPSIAGIPANHLVVIGDSISAGIDSRTPSWPAIFQQMTGVPVTNLAKAGASVADARVMADKITPDDQLVLIEIGGNDLLASTPSVEFDRNLELLLSRLAAPRRTLVMFELPLLPNTVAYGRIQRRLAAKYGVWLIPKHYLVGVIGGRGATLDGLHLSQSGAQHMASLIAKSLSSVVRSSTLASARSLNSPSELPPVILSSSSPAF